MNHTLSAARILKEAMTCSEVSVSPVSRVMKSTNAWNVTTPDPSGSTRDMMRANSASPCRQTQRSPCAQTQQRHCRTAALYQIIAHGDQTGSEIIRLHAALLLLQKSANTNYQKKCLQTILLLYWQDKLQDLMMNSSKCFERFTTRRRWWTSVCFYLISNQFYTFVDVYI